MFFSSGASPGALLQTFASRAQSHQAPEWVSPGSMGSHHQWNDSHFTAPWCSQKLGAMLGNVPSSHRPSVFAPCDLGTFQILRFAMDVANLFDTVSFPSDQDFNRLSCRIFHGTYLCSSKTKQDDGFSYLVFQVDIWRFTWICGFGVTIEAPDRYWPENKS